MKPAKLSYLLGGTSDESSEENKAGAKKGDRGGRP